MMVYDFEAQVMETSELPFLLSLELLAWGKPAAMFQGHLNSSREKSSWQVANTSCQQLAKSGGLLSTAMGLGILKEDSPAPFKLSDDCRLCQ